MNAKETAELRRRTKPNRSNITEFQGCFVDEKKKIISQFKIPVSDMTTSEAESFFSYIKKVMDGKHDRELINLSFTPELIEDSDAHRTLKKLLDASLKDKDALSSFFQKIIDALELKGDYLILAASDAYDVKKKGKSVTSDADDDDENIVYRYILCAICPVKASKMTLEYKEKTKDFRSSEIAQLLKDPLLGFLYPAFDNRRTNLYGALLFSKDPKQNWKTFLRAIFDVNEIVAPEAQKMMLGKVISESLGDESTIDVLQAVFDRIDDQISFSKENKDTEPPSVGVQEIDSALGLAGVTDEGRERFRENYAKEFGEGARVPAQNINNDQTLKFDIGKEIKVRTEKKYMEAITIESKDGRPRLVIDITDLLTMNGWPVKVPDLDDTMIELSLKALFGESFGLSADEETIPGEE